MATAEAAFQPGSLLTRFVAPPFSVLDTRQGYWQERRRSWLSLGMQSELGRGADAEAFATGATRGGGGMVATTVGKAGGLISSAAERRDDKVLASAGMLYDDEVHRTVARMGTDYDTEAGENAWGGSGTSIFDPVLCELAYRWWAPERGRILDPFAGGSVRGLVAAMLGHPYTGIDLSAAQLAANRAQAGRLLGPEHPVPVWHHGDTLEVMPTLEAEGYDMVMTCPPYYDLEVYSADPRDLSNVAWGEFVTLYAQAMAASARLLRDGRFSVWVVSEIRDEQGYCRGLVPLTVQVAEAAGLRLYNEAVLVNSPGSLPVRVTRYMEASRKLGRSHQNVLCFIKGSPPRGWSYERAAPPSPQLSLFGAESAPEVPAGEPALPPVPEPVVVGVDLAAGEDATVTVYAEAYRFVADEDAADAPYGEDLAVAALGGPLLTFAPPEAWPADLKWDGLEAGWGEGQPEPTTENAPDPSSAVSPGSAGSMLLEDGRTVDRSTGEIYERAVPATRVRLPTTSAQPAPMSQEDWYAQRGRLWNPGDNDRPCWECGRAPTGAYRDGSPSYDHTHSAQVLEMFSEGEVKS